MILGIGIDLVAVNRIAPWLKNKALCERYFHPLELKEVFSRGADAASALAARFAAKEAFAKALGTGFQGLRLREIRVENTVSGRPQLILEGGAQKRLEHIGAGRIHLSLSHELDLAAAQVVLEAADA